MPTPTEIALLFDKLALAVTERRGDVRDKRTNAIKARNFAYVAEHLRGLTELRSSSDVAGVPRFGKGTLRRIQEILDTGTLAELGAPPETGEMTDAAAGGEEETNGPHAAEGADLWFSVLASRRPV